MRRNTLYARRLVGDIGPLNTDPARRLPGRIIAPAVSIDGVYQDYDVASDDQHYRIGSRMVVDDRVFHYGRAGNTLDCSRGAKNALPQCVVGAAAVVAITEGAYTIEITVAVTDGALLDGAVAEDELVGGYIVIFGTVGEEVNRRIVGNTERAAPGGAMTVTLDRPCPADIAAPTGEIMASPYLNVQTDPFAAPRAGQEQDKSVVGMPPIAATVSQYLWLQTWGPVWIAPSAGVGVGLNNKLVIFAGNGTIVDQDVTDAPTYGGQLAGYVLAPNNVPPGNQGAPFVQLMLAP